MSYIKGIVASLAAAVTMGSAAAKKKFACL